VFTVADTVFYRKSSVDDQVTVPDAWYFTSKDGYILKKNRLNVNAAEIHKAFSKRMELYD